jgi:hypothetical protein
LQQKKQLQKNTGKKVRVQKKPVQKKSSMPWNCQIATRLVFTWCGCNLVKKYRWLQHPLHVVATSDVQQLQKKWQLQNQNVGDCLRPYSSVIASIGACVVRNCRLRVFGKKEKTAAWRCQIATRLMFAWCGCNQVKNTVDCLISNSVVATTDVLRLQKKTVAKPSMW